MAAEQPICEVGERGCSSCPSAEWSLLAALVAAAGMALRFGGLGGAALVGDEGYYWLWSRFPALGYFDNPGGTAWMIGVSTVLGGNSELGIRWLNALLGSLTALLAFGLGRRLHSNWSGLWSSVMVAVGAPFLVVSRYVYTDALPCFLLLVNLHLLWPILTDGQLHRHRSWLRWIGIGLTWALLLNTKVSVYPYFVGLATGLVLWRTDVLRQPRLLATTVWAAFGIVPLLWWNATHDWVGLQWIWKHSTEGALPAQTLWGALRHMVAYVTPPLLFCGMPGLAQWRDRRARWLWVTGLALVFPVLLSPANSPRNLTMGGLLLLVASSGWIVDCSQRTSWFRAAACMVLLALSVYAGGTVVGFRSPTWLPQSGAADLLWQEGLGVRELGAELREVNGILFTLDYHLAGQLWYYSGRPVYSSWGQYLVWGLPDFRQATVLHLDYLTPAAVRPVLVAVFSRVEGPTEHRLSDRGKGSIVYMWRGEGLMIDVASFQQMLDIYRFADSARR